jgi:hypothetical protein
MKPKKNPMHKNYIDSSESVFKKFEIDILHKMCGGHNNVYKNKHFAIRITKRIYKEDEDDTNSSKYLNKEEKSRDEELLIKAIKNNVAPNTYLMSNILLDGNIHRYCVMESYDMCLTTFLRKEIFLGIMEKDECCYNNKKDLFEDIVDQLCSLNEKIINMGILFYDFKSDNIVIKSDPINGKITLKIIDWDSDLCVEEPWLENYKDTCAYINLLICGYYMNVYANSNILYEKIKYYYSKISPEDIFYIVFELDSEYLSVILHYFNKQFKISESFKEKLDLYRLDDDIEFIKKKIYFLLQQSCLYSSYYLNNPHYRS